MSIDVSSEVVSKWVKRVAPIVDELDRLQPGMSAAISKSNSFKLLEEICKSVSTKEKQFVVIEHPSVFEIALLPKGLTRNLFANTSGKGNVEFMDVTEEDAVVSLAKEFLQKDIGTLKKYLGKVHNLEEFHSGQMVVVNYIQIRCSRLAIFKKYPKPSDAVTDTIQRLADKGVLQIMDKDAIKAKYGSSPKLIRFTKPIEVKKDEH